MDEQQIDSLTRSVAYAMDRRTGVRGLLALGGVLGGVLGISGDAMANANGKCKPTCSECRQCKKGKCHKGNSGKKQCKKGKCKPKDNGTACSTGTCQAGVCQAVPPPAPGCGTDGVTCTGNADCCEGLSCKGGTCQDSSCIEDSVALQMIISAASPGDTMPLCAGTWNLASTAHIATDLTLRGAGAAKTILDGGSAVGVLNIAAGITATLQDLTITKGNTVNGGGVHNEGVLTLLGVSVTGNAATNDGGGIFNVGVLELQTGSSVTDNAAGSLSGGIHNSGTMTLQSGSRVTDNTAANGGGGIFNDQGGTVTLEGPDPSPTVVNNCHDNCAGATVAKCAAIPVSC